MFLDGSLASINTKFQVSSGVWFELEPKMEHKHAETHTHILVDTKNNKFLVIFAKMYNLFNHHVLRMNQCMFICLKKKKFFLRPQWILYGITIEISC